MKKIISISMSVLIIFTMLSFCVSAIEQYDGSFVYDVLEDGTVEIWDCQMYDEVLIIPEKIAGRKVTVLSQSAFNCDHKEIIIPDTVEVIENGTFEGNRHIEKITIGSGVKTLGDNFFKDCENLKSVTLSDSITSIGATAFYNCVNLESVQLGDNIEKIGYSAFKNTAFKNNEKNWDGPFLYSGNYLLEVDGSKLSKPETDTVEIKEGTTLIADLALSRNYSKMNFKKIVLPESLKYIGQWAFEGQDSLEEVTFGKNVSRIDRYAFYDCSNLKSVKIPETVKKIGDCAFGCEYDNEKGKYVAIKDFSITGYANTAAEKYAEKYNIEFNCQKPKTPKAKITKKGKKIRVKCSNLVGADGIQVRYTVGKKTYTKTYNSKLTSTKTLSNLKKGKYKVKVRAFANQNGKKLYSKWTKVKTVKVK